MGFNSAFKGLNELKLTMALQWKYNNKYTVKVAKSERGMKIYLLIN